ncbi:hypothetical protein [Shewanella sp. GXUN23E]|uniref:hypothetical protein n=1 Tax=Shewanella sp. GXUN23E TaxID=3422498 RepID=UPI003D7E5790
MKAISALLVSALLSVSVMANEAAEEQSPVATLDEVVSLLNDCSARASEQSVADEDLEQFVLDCVNEQLSDMGYQQIESLPVVE